MSIGGDVIAVGAPSADVGDDFEAGRVCLCTRDGGDVRSWRQTAMITSSDPDWFDQFGESVDVGEEFVAVSSGSRDRGAAYLFTRTGAPVAKLTAPNINSIGVDTSVAIEGPSAVLTVDGLDQEGQFLPGSIWQFDRVQGATPGPWRPPCAGRAAASRAPSNLTTAARCSGTARRWTCSPCAD